MNNTTAGLVARLRANARVLIVAGLAFSVGITAQVMTAAPERSLGTPPDQIKNVSVADSPADGTLIFADEFNQGPGLPPDATRWSLKLTDKWQPAAELQTYTNALDNAQTDGRGGLNIKAASTGPNTWTSARLQSNGFFRYGLFKARIKVPTGAGTWGAFWLLGDDSVYGWPKCGEIDIMEAPMSATESGRIYAGTHQSNATGGHVGLGVPHQAISDLNGNFHTYAVDWKPGRLDFYLDEKLTGSITKASVEAQGGLWLFDAQPQRIILNLAIGGWAGTPGTWTSQAMNVDWVRVYQN